MHIVIVKINIRPDFLEKFRSATLENAKNSVTEPGVVRFDFYQRADDHTKFVLLEIYKTPEDQLKHRETDHYLKWRDEVTNLMAEPRTSVNYVSLFPPDLES
jgi:quinol monooxygenase YgiN